MDRPMPNVAFQVMSFMFRARDLWSPRESILRELDIEPGFSVLDYGCGPGSYVADLSARVGPSGCVYALDLHPLAVARVQALAKRKRLTNVKTIRSDCRSGLPDRSVDVVLLYDIYHMLSDPDGVLAELHRVRKPGGMLSVLDPHMAETELVLGVTRGGLFRLAYRGEKTHRFQPVARSADDLG